MRRRAKSRAQRTDMELRFQSRVDPNDRPVNIARIRGLIVRLAIDAWRRRAGAEDGVPAKGAPPEPTRRPPRDREAA